MKDLIEILKNVPKGTKLYSTIHGDIYFDHIDATNIYPVKCYGNSSRFHFTKDGKHYYDYDGECVLFPSKEQRDWNKFEYIEKFQYGDIIYNRFQKFISICNGIYTRFDLQYELSCNRLYSDLGLPIAICKKDYRLATKEEQKIFFKALKENNLYWDKNNKELIEIEYKVGDYLKKDDKTYKVISINDSTYSLQELEFKYKFTVPFKDQYEYALTEYKFDITTLKPYDKVLARYNNDSVWRPQIFSYLDINLEHNNYKFVIVGLFSIPQCIPYEGNEHLVGTTNDCDEFYKTWE